MLNEKKEVFILDRIKVSHLYEAANPQGGSLLSPSHRKFSRSRVSKVMWSPRLFSNTLANIRAGAAVELEGHLLDHPDVADGCVVGVPDDCSGEVPLAFVVLSHLAQDRVKAKPTEVNTIKAALIKVGTTPVFSATFHLSHGARRLPACRRCQGGIQTAHGRCRNYRRDPEEPQR